MIVNAANVDRVRSLMCARRRRLGVGVRQRTAHKLMEQLNRYEVFQSSQHIACYWAIMGELNCLPVIKRIWHLGKHCYLPVIDFTASQPTMVFREYRPGEHLVLNRYGIAEPVAGCLCEVRDLDCVLTPLVAFDKNHHRIGMGGGFYDRAFAADMVGNMPQLIGAAYRFQEVRRIEPQPWDRALDKVIKV